MPHGWSIAHEQSSAALGPRLMRLLATRTIVKSQLGAGSNITGQFNADGSDGLMILPRPEEYLRHPSPQAITAGVGPR